MANTSLPGCSSKFLTALLLMIGGSIPGKTKVASIAIYEEVEALNYTAANFYSLVLFVITFCILLLVYLINGGYLKRFWK